LKNPQGNKGKKSAAGAILSGGAASKRAIGSRRLAHPSDALGLNNTSDKPAEDNPQERTGHATAQLRGKSTSENHELQADSLSTPREKACMPRAQERKAKSQEGKLERR